jgi:hypothetical protein
LIVELLVELLLPYSLLCYQVQEHSALIRRASFSSDGYAQGEQIQNDHPQLELPLFRFPSSSGMLEDLPAYKGGGRFQGQGCHHLLSGGGR